MTPRYRATFRSACLVIHEATHSVRVWSAPFGLLITAAVLGACGTGRDASHASAGASVMPGPGPLARPNATAANAACEGCHAEAAATWRASLHARAWSDPVFQRSFLEEPATFCRNCHAPETGAPALGVACVTCHDPAGTGVVLASVPTPAARGPAPHRVLRDPAFAGDRACASCHEFAFPDAAQRDDPTARMQRTISEHAASRFADRTCASCHMPKGTHGGRSHGFEVASDPAMLRRALVAQVTRTDESVVFELAPGEVGHAFPTGDLFRRLVLTAEVVGEDYQLVAHAVRALARHFRFEAGAHGGKFQRELSDDRVQGGPQQVEIRIGPQARGQAIRWRIEWQRVQSMHEEHAVIADTVVVAEGRLPPQSPGRVDHTTQTPDGPLGASR